MILVPMRTRFWAVLAVCFGLPSCGGGQQHALDVLGPGVINNPANRSLRFDLLKFGLKSFCREMLERGTGLKLEDSQPVLGRFFADSCSSQVLDDESRKSLVVQFAGKGYAWLGPAVGRIGFRAASVVEYAPDFQLHDGALYVYFRPRNIDSSSFETRLVESAPAGATVSLLGLAVPANEAGARVVKSQLERGFTVIRYGSDGETDFGVGYVPVGQRPSHPFQVQYSDKVTLGNDRAEIHSGQQDFLGGFPVVERDQALYFTAALDGAPNIDIALLSQADAQTMLSRYVSQAGPAAFPGPPLFDETVVAGQPYKRYVPVPPGTYYVLLDNTSAAGRSTPSVAPGDDRAGKLDYLVQLGPKP